MRESTSTRTCATPLGVEHPPPRNSPPIYAKSSKPASLTSVNTTSTATAVGCRRWHTAATELFKRCHADCEQYKTLGFRWLPLILGSPFPLVIIWTHQVYVVPITCNLTSGSVIRTPHAFSPINDVHLERPVKFFGPKLSSAFWKLNWSFNKLYCCLHQNHLKPKIDKNMMTINTIHLDCLRVPRPPYHPIYLRFGMSYGLESFQSQPVYDIC